MRTYYKKKAYEAGCDEAGRGPLAGPVFAAAVILDPKARIKGLNDSKLLTEEQRKTLRSIIEEKALAWVVSHIEVKEIDKINILQASLKAMRNCILQLKIQPEFVLVDGNKEIPYLQIHQKCIIKGDQQFESIAAASILAKTYRDEYMISLHEEFPHYGWKENKGYPTFKHRQAILEFGLCKYHRKSFQVKLPVLEIIG